MLEGFALQGELQLVSAPNRPYLQARQMSTDNLDGSKSQMHIQIWYVFAVERVFTRCMATDKNSLPDNNILHNTVVKLNVTPRHNII